MFCFQQKVGNHKPEVIPGGVLGYGDCRGLGDAFSGETISDGHDHVLQGLYRDLDGQWRRPVGPDFKAQFEVELLL